MVKDDITLQLGQRWASALRKYFSKRNTAKEIARFFDVEVRTANNWLQGNAPYMKYLWVAGQKLGSSFLAEILVPNENLRTENIEKALDLMEKQICQIRQEISSLTEGDK